MLCPRLTQGFFAVNSAISILGHPQLRAYPKPLRQRTHHGHTRSSGVVALIHVPRSLLNLVAVTSLQKAHRTIKTL